ncbi:MAG: SIMPL domain-containing protein [Mariprofundaceae bacterium]
MNYLIIIALCFVTPAWAVNQIESQNTQIQLSATASQQVANNEAVIIYQVQARGQHADQLRLSVNQVSHTIHQALKHEKGLQQQTLNRQMQMTWRYEPKRKQQVHDGWSIEQVEQIKTENLDELSKVLDLIEKSGAHIKQLRFQVSDDLRQKTIQKLRFQAITKFRKQSADFAKALDAQSFHILNLHSNQTQPRYPQPQVRMAMSSKAEHAPNFEAGQAKINVTISGKIELPLKNYPVQP